MPVDTLDLNLCGIISGTEEIFLIYRLEYRSNMVMGSMSNGVGSGEGFG